MKFKILIVFWIKIEYKFESIIKIKLGLLKL